MYWCTRSAKLEHILSQKQHLKEGEALRVLSLWSAVLYVCQSCAMSYWSAPHLIPNRTIALMCSTEKPHNSETMNKELADSTLAQSEPVTVSERATTIRPDQLIQL